MATRYSGDLKISVRYDDARNDYPVSISRNGRKLWRGVVRPAASGFGRGVSYDSARAYDEIAESALAFADDDKGSSISDHAELDANGYKVRRVPRYWEQYPGGQKAPKKFARRDQPRKTGKKAWEIWADGHFVEAFKDKGEAQTRIRRLRKSHPRTEYRLRRRKSQPRQQFSTRSRRRYATTASKRRS